MTWTTRQGWNKYSLQDASGSEKCDWSIISMATILDSVTFPSTHCRWPKPMHHRRNTETALTSGDIWQGMCHLHRANLWDLLWNTDCSLCHCARLWLDRRYKPEIQLPTTYSKNKKLHILVTSIRFWCFKSQLLLRW